MKQFLAGVGKGTKSTPESNTRRVGAEPRPEGSPLPEPNGYMARAAHGPAAEDRNQPARQQANTAVEAGGKE